MAKNTLDYRYSSVFQDQEKRDYRVRYTSDQIWGPSGRTITNPDKFYFPQPSKNITLTYSYQVAPYNTTDGMCYPFGENLQQMAQISREQLSSFANIAWRAGNPDKANIQYSMCDSLGKDAIGEKVGGEANYPSNQPIKLRVLAEYEKVDQGRAVPEFLSHFTTLTYILNAVGITKPAIIDPQRQEVVDHEAGHNMGLAHPHPMEITIPDYTKDVTQMSYYSGQYAAGPRQVPSNSSVDLPPYSDQYGIMDIFTLQRFYGKNTEFHAGNDVYHLNGQDRIKTIYDAGGFNSYDASSSSSCVPDSVYINANPDLHRPSTVGQTGVFTAFSGPHEIIGGSWDNVIHGSVAHANQIDLSAAKGSQWVIPAGHDNTILLNPDAYGAASLDYRSMGVFIGKGKDTVFGFSPQQDRIISDAQWKDIKLAPSGAYNMTLPNNSTQLVTNGTLIGLGRNQNIVLAGVPPESMNEGHFQRNGTLAVASYPDACGQSFLAYLCKTTSLCTVPTQIAIGTTLAFKEEIVMVVKAAVQKYRGVPEQQIDAEPDVTVTLPKIVGKLAVNLAWDGVAVAARTALPVASFTHDVVKSMKDGALEYYAFVKPEPVIVPDIENQLLDQQPAAQPGCLDSRGCVIAASANVGLLSGVKTAVGYTVFSVIDNKKLYPFYTVRDLAKGVSESVSNPDATHESWRKRGGKAVISGIKSVATGIIARTRFLRHLPETVEQLHTWKSSGHAVVDSGQVVGNGPQEQPAQQVELSRINPVVREVRYAPVLSASVPRGNQGLPRSHSYTEGLAADIPFVQRIQNNHDVVSRSY